MSPENPSGLTPIQPHPIFVRFSNFNLILLGSVLFSFLQQIQLILWNYTFKENEIILKVSAVNYKVSLK